MSLLEMIAALGNACFFELEDDLDFLDGDGFGSGYGFFDGNGDTEIMASDYQCRL